VDRITSLVADFGRSRLLEATRRCRIQESVRAGEIIDEVCTRLRVEAQFRDCSIDVGESSQASLLGSHELLRRAIENVLRNGIRYSPKAICYSADSCRE